MSKLEHKHNTVNKQGYGLNRKGRGSAVNVGRHLRKSATTWPRSIGVKPTKTLNWDLQFSCLT